MLIKLHNDFSVYKKKVSFQYSISVDAVDAYKKKERL